MEKENEVQGVLYAPVAITTLNRFSHLKKCIESLQFNTLAKSTDIFISVDFPPCEEYANGWEKICKYIGKGIEGFHNTYIFFQNENLGPRGNEIFLRKKIKSKYDRYIFTEDDNEFFPCFLEYINKGLDLFKEDDDIISVCAAEATGIDKNCNMIDGNVVKACDFSGYGYGFWIDKEKKFETIINREYFKKISRNADSLKKLFRRDYALFFAFTSALLKKENLYVSNCGEIECIDMTLKIYMFFENKYSIFPRKWLVHNNGHDGSGQNSVIVPLAPRPIAPKDGEKHFEYILPNPFEASIQNYPRPQKNKLEILLRYFICRLEIYAYNFLGDKLFFGFQKKVRGERK